MSSAARLRVRLVPVAAAAWATALATTFVPIIAGPVALTLWASAGALVVTMARRRTQPAPSRSRLGRRGVVIGVLLLVAAAATASHVALAQPARDGAAGLAVSGGRALTIDATVTGKVERRASGHLEFDAVASRIQAGDSGRPVRIEITVRVQPDDVERAGSLDVGAVIEARGTARPARPGERAVLDVSASQGVTVTRPPTGVLAVAADLRRGLIASVAGLPEPGAGLVPGLAVGDTVLVGGELDSAMKASSLSHLTAVSGANCAIVVGLAFAAAAAAGASRGVRVCSGLAALAGFVVLVTPEPSVVRAAAMAAIAMLGVLLGRPGVGMAILSLAVTVLLVADPWLASSLGFALSAVATASLLLFARPLAVGLTRHMPRALALAIAVPLAAQLACGPLLILIEPTVPLYGVVANLLAAPGAPVATIVGLAACLAAPLPWLQSGLAAIAWLPASWIAGTATTFATLPGGGLPWLEGWVGVLALLIVGCAVGVLVALPRTGAKSTRVILAVAALLVSTIIGVGLGHGAVTTIAGRWTLPPEWTVLACDVGQGDAVLLRTDEAVALIDTGPEPELLDACLSRAGVGPIDLLVLTHFDLDHIGGADAVAGRVGTIVHGPPASPADDRVLATLAAHGAEAVAAHAGMRGSLGDARWRVLWPPRESRAFPEGNDASVVLDVRGGALPTTLLLGDLSASPQRALAASGVLKPPYDLVKVAHHGSADQDAGLYRLARPALGLVTVGAENDYGHPRAEILQTLQRGGAHVARTDLDGMTAIWRADDRLLVWRERGGAVAGAP